MYGFQGAIREDNNQQQLLDDDDLFPEFDIENNFENISVSKTRSILSSDEEEEESHYQIQHNNSQDSTIKVSKINAKIFKTKKSKAPILFKGFVACRSQSSLRG